MQCLLDSHVLISPSRILGMQGVILSSYGLNPSLADFPVTVAAEAGLFHSSAP